jgi:hypothetical protein
VGLVVKRPLFLKQHPGINKVMILVHKSSLESGVQYNQQAQATSNHVENIRLIQQQSKPKKFNKFK